MSTTVTDYELSIPGKFVHLFRLSLIDELDADADWIKQQTAAVSEFYADPEDVEDADDVEEKAYYALDARLADLVGPVRSLAEDHTMFEQIARHKPLRDLALRGSFETLHGALEATIRRAARDLVAECDYAPIDGGEIVQRSSAAIWAAEEIERLRTEHTDRNGGDA